MQCIRPWRIRNPKKDFRPGIDEPWLNVPCGKCTSCLQRYKMAWSNRLIEHGRDVQNKFFCDCTYDEFNVPIVDLNTGVLKPLSEFAELHNIGSICLGLLEGDEQHYAMSLDKKESVRFIKRLRKRFPWHFSYFLVGEYGEFGRPHYHFHLFIDAPGVILKHDDIVPFLYEAWPYGFGSIAPVTDRDIRYTCKYALKQQIDYKTPNCVQRPFMLCSKGIGKSYLENASNFNFHGDSVERMYYPISDKFKSYMPRYWKEKLFSESTRKEFADMMQLRKSQQSYDDFIKEYNDTVYQHRLIENNLRKQAVPRSIPIKLY